MRLLRLRAARFGPFRGCVLELDDEAVVVFGRNESGKSTFRSAVETGTRAQRTGARRTKRGSAAAPACASTSRPPFGPVSRGLRPWRFPA